MIAKEVRSQQLPSETSQTGAGAHLQMRIAQVSPYALEEVSGISGVILNLRARLSSEGVEFEILCPTSATDESLGSSGRIVLSARRGRNLELAMRTLFAILTRRHTLDIVHAHQPHLQCVASLLLARILGIRSLLTLHVRTPEPRPISRRTTNLMVRWAWRCANTTVTVSKRVQRDFMLPPCRVVPNGVPIPAKPANGRDADSDDLGTRLVFAGRVSRDKGIFVLLEAMRNACKELESLKLTTFGPIESELAYQSAKAAFGIDHLVEDRGFDPEWRGFLRDGQVFVLPSFYEGVPLTLLEAMAAAIPVITTSVGGVPDVVESPETGILVEPGDVGALTKAIVWICSHRLEASAMGRRARQRVQGLFSDRAMAAAYLDIYKRLFSATSRTAP